MADFVPVEKYPSLSAQEAQAEILRIRARLTEAQQRVIHGKLKPGDYKHLERDEVAKIHKLEERLSKLMGY